MARFANLSAASGWMVLVHPASFQDVKRDKNEARRAIVLSKLKKYPELDHPPDPTPEFLLAVGGGSSEQDDCDNRLLFAVKANAVSLLVTEDKGIHAKARKAGLEERVYYVTQCVALIEHLDRTHKAVPPTVRLRPLHAVSLRDPIFDSLRSDYDFDAWFNKSARNGRECWLVGGADGSIAAICIFKPEPDPMPQLRGSWLKLCTFKVAAEMSGRKLGELLLKTAFNYCAGADIPGVYLTAYPKQSALIAMMGDFGFQQVQEEGASEVVLAKRFAPPAGAIGPEDGLEFNRTYFPSFRTHESIGNHIVPVRPHFHELLFPEWPSQFAQAGFFPSAEPVSNAIRKAYLCNSPTTRIKPGDLLYFYRSNDKKVVTTIAVAERTLRSTKAEDVAAFVGKRTVYSLAEITELCDKGEVLAIVFRQCRHAPRPLRFKRLRAAGIVRNHLESITWVPPGEARLLREEAGL